MPAVLLVTRNIRVPATSAPLAGKPSLASVVSSVTDVALLTMFQFASTALTVTV